MRIAVIIFILFSCHVNSADFSIGLGGFNEPQGERYGGEVAAWVEFDNHFSFRFSGLVFNGKNSYQQSDMFGGFSVAGFVHLNQPINPYLGIGIQGSDTVYCSFFDDDEDDWFSDEECVDSKHNVLAIYPEFGIRFNLGPVKVTPFVRRYFDTHDNLPVTNAYGVMFSLYFDSPSNF